MDTQTDSRLLIQVESGWQTDGRLRLRPETYVKTDDRRAVELPPADPCLGLRPREAALKRSPADGSGRHGGVARPDALGRAWGR